MPITYPYKFSDWYGYDKDCTGTTNFQSSTGYDILNVCSGSINKTYSHDGSGTYPAAGDTVYDELGNTVGDNYYKFNSTWVYRITGGSGVVANTWPQDLC
jgi:hypothetical protein